MSTALIQTLCAAFLAIPFALRSLGEGWVAHHPEMGGGSMTSAGHHIMLEGASTPPAPAYWGLCFTAEEPNVVVNMAKTGSPPAVTLETSTDGVTWTAFDADGGTTPITLAAIGDRVFFRAGAAGNAQISSGTSVYRSFTLSGKCAASGNCMSLISASNPDVDFSASYAFADLFKECASLTSAPNLPSKTITGRVYQDMFRGCTSLISAPELPSTTLSAYCYYGMFNGCASLTTAPELPATTLANGCYQIMFRGCVSLLATPSLKATASTLLCYQYMFDGCSSLKWAEVHLTTWGMQANHVSWMTNVAATGTFRCPTALGTNETITRGPNYCPENWTVVNID